MRRDVVARPGLLAVECTAPFEYSTAEAALCPGSASPAQGYARGHTRADLRLSGASPSGERHEPACVCEYLIDVMMTVVDHGRS